jgi:hypothetical protein
MAVNPGIDGRGVVFSTASLAACVCSRDTAPPAGCPQMRTDAHPIASPGSTLCVEKNQTNTVVCFLPEIDARSSRLRCPAARRCVREQRWRGPGAQHGDAEDDVHCAKNTAGPRVLKNLGTLPPAPELSLSLFSTAEAVDPQDPRVYGRTGRRSRGRRLRHFGGHGRRHPEGRARGLNSAANAV